MKRLAFLSLIACAHLPIATVEVAPPDDVQTSADRPTLLASADIGATVSDWYTRAVLAQPVDPNRPRFISGTVTGTWTVGRLSVSPSGSAAFGTFITGPNGNTIGISATNGNGFDFNNNLKSLAAFISSVNSGSNGFACTQNGCRFDFGAGANDYASSDGTTITFAAPIATSGSGSITAGGGFVGQFAAVNATNQPTNGMDLATTNTPRISANTTEVVRFQATGPTLSISDGTAGSGTGFTTNATGFVSHRVHKITVTNAALTAAATTQDLNIWLVPTKTRVLRMVVDVTAVFDDAAGPISAVTITCGTSAGGAQYVASSSVFTVNTIGDVAAEIGAGLTSATVADIPSFSSTTQIQCRFTSTGGNLSTLTTGSATFYIEHLVYP